MTLLVREPGSGIRDTLEFCIRGQGVLFLPSVQAAPFISSGKLFELSIKDIEFKRDYFFPIIIKNISPRVCSASRTICSMTLYPLKLTNNLCNLCKKGVQS